MFLSVQIPNLFLGFMVKLLFWLHINNACPLNFEIFRSDVDTHICKMHSNHNYLTHTRENEEISTRS